MIEKVYGLVSARGIKLTALDFSGKKKWPDEKEIISFARYCHIAEKETIEIINKIEEGKKGTK
jgi:hypothetical protein